MQVSDEVLEAMCRAQNEAFPSVEWDELGPFLQSQRVHSMRAALEVLPDDAWHSGWQVAVRERDEARAELQRERLRHAQTKDQADRFATELGELRRAEQPASLQDVWAVLGLHEALLRALAGLLRDARTVDGYPVVAVCDVMQALAPLDARKAGGR
jgi:hypothetical protein